MGESVARAARAAAARQRRLNFAILWCAVVEWEPWWGGREPEDDKEIEAGSYGRGEAGGVGEREVRGEREGQQSRNERERGRAGDALS